MNFVERRAARPDAAVEGSAHIACAYQLAGFLKARS